MSGCIKNEPLNTEADIVKCILPPGILKSDPLITNNTVLLLILPGTAEIDHLAPEFELTPGATIKPKSGTVRDFTTPQTYTVTSEDGQWSKVYTVTVSQTDIPTVYDFEHWRTANKYETPYEVLEPGNEEMNIWASGNAGFAIAAGNAAKPDDFPTFSTTDAYQGKLAAQLVTRSTGKWGALAGMPIAAGNLFIGTFDGSSAMADPLGATHFGLPLGQKPVRFLGHYRYISGGNVTGKDGKEIIPVRRDIGQIYAILYETDDNVQYPRRQQHHHFAQHRRTGHVHRNQRDGRNRIRTVRRHVRIYENLTILGRNKRTSGTTWPSFSPRANAELISKAQWAARSISMPYK